jgi:hypothetical protein
MDCRETLSKARSRPQAAYQRHEKKDDEDNEQDVRDAAGKAGDSEEPQSLGDQRYDEEYDCVIKHLASACSSMANRSAFTAVP